jgi:hypothetical protein
MRRSLLKVVCTPEDGVPLDETKNLPGFDYTFHETKPSSGRILPALAQAWNVVNCFADNTPSQEKPNLVATFNGERAVRGIQRDFYRIESIRAE